MLGLTQEALERQRNMGGSLSFNTPEYAAAVDLKNKADTSFNLRGLPIGGDTAQSFINSAAGVWGGIADFAGNPGGIGDSINDYVVAQESAMGEKPKAGFTWDYIANGLGRDFGNVAGSMAGMVVPAAVGAAAAPFLGLGGTGAAALAAGGALAGAGLESMAEGGNKMRDSLANGDDLSTAQGKARTVAGENFGLLAPTNLIGLGAIAKAAKGVRNAYRGARGLSAAEGAVDATTAPTLFGRALTPRQTAAVDFAKGAGLMGAGAANEGIQEALQQGISDSVDNKDWGILPQNWNEEQQESFNSTIGPMAIMSLLGGGARAGARRLGYGNNAPAPTQSDVEQNVAGPTIGNNIFGAGTADITTQGTDIDEQVAGLKDGWQAVIPQIAGVIQNEFGITGAQISSGFRNREHNAEVGGAENSYHVGDGNRGDALDIVLPDGTTPEQAEAIRAEFENSGAFNEVLFHDSGSGYHLHLGGLNVDDTTNSGTYSGNADIDSIISDVATQYGVDPALLAAIAEQESGFNQDANSGAGAIGIMQLMPETAQGLGVDPSDLRGNIEGGAKYLRQMLDTYNGDTEKALAAYNAGPGALDSVNGDISRLSSETQSYVPSVIEKYKKYKGRNPRGVVGSNGNILNWDGMDEDYRNMNFFRQDGQNNQESHGTASEFLENLAKLSESENAAERARGDEAMNALQEYSEDEEKLTQAAEELGYNKIVDPTEAYNRMPIKPIVAQALNDGQVTFATSQAADLFATHPIAQTMERDGNTFKATDNFRQNEAVNNIQQSLGNNGIGDMQQAQTRTDMQNGTAPDVASQNTNEQSGQPTAPAPLKLSNNDIGRINAIAPNMPAKARERMQEFIQEGDRDALDYILRAYEAETPLNFFSDDVNELIKILRAWSNVDEALGVHNGMSAQERQERVTKNRELLENIYASGDVNNLMANMEVMEGNLLAHGYDPVEVLQKYSNNPRKKGVPLTPDETSRLNGIWQSAPQNIRNKVQSLMSEGKYNDVRSIIRSLSENDKLRAKDVTEAKGMLNALMGIPEAMEDTDGNRIDENAVRGYMASNNLPAMNRILYTMSNNLIARGINPQERLRNAYDNMVAEAERNNPTDNTNAQQNLPAVQGERMPSTEVADNTVYEGEVESPIAPPPPYNSNQIEDVAVHPDGMNSDEFKASLNAVERGFMDYLDNLFNSVSMGFNETLDYLKARRDDILNKRLEQIKNTMPDEINGFSGRMDIPSDVAGAWSTMLSMRQNYGASLANAAPEIQAEYNRVEGIVNDFLQPIVHRECLNNNVSYGRLNNAIKGLEGIADKARKYEELKGNEEGRYDWASESSRAGRTQSYRDVSAEEQKAVEGSATVWGEVLRTHDPAIRMNEYLRTIKNKFVHNAQRVSLHGKAVYNGRKMNKAERVEALLQDGRAITKRDGQFFADTADGEIRITEAEYGYYKWLNANFGRRRQRASEDNQTHENKQSDIPMLNAPGEATADTASDSNSTGGAPQITASSETTNTESTDTQNSKVDLQGLARRKVEEQNEREQLAGIAERILNDRSKQQEQSEADNEQGESTEQDEPNGKKQIDGETPTQSGDTTESKEIDKETERVVLKTYDTLTEEGKEAYEEARAVLTQVGFKESSENDKKYMHALSTMLAFRAQVFANIMHVVYGEKDYTAKKYIEGLGLRQEKLPPNVRGVHHGFRHRREKEFDLELSYIALSKTNSTRLSTSVLIHELGHGILQEMHNAVLRENCPEQLKKDFQTVIEWISTTKKPRTSLIVADGRKGGYKTDRYVNEEKFAQGLVNYFNDTNREAMPNDIARAFSRIAKVIVEYAKRYIDWLNRAMEYGNKTDIAKAREYSIPELPDNIAEAIDRMFTGYGEKPQPKKINPKSRATVITSDGKEYNVHYEVMDESEVISSTRDDGSVNENFPAELQPRERNRMPLLEQVKKMANNLRPADLWAARKVNEGAPIVNSLGQVLSGNGRTMAIRRAYNNGKADKYKQYLTTHAEELGLNSADIENMKNPILVKVVDGKLTKGDIESIVNDTTGGQRMGASEQAKMDAKKLKSSTIASYIPNVEGSLNTAANNEFAARALSDIVGENETNAYYNGKGEITSDGYDRVKRAIFALAYGDPYLIDSFAETNGEAGANFINAMQANAPMIAQLNDSIKKGALHDLSLAKTIVDAVNALRAAMKNGERPENIWMHDSLFGEAQTTQATQNMARVLYDFRRSGKKLTNFIGSLIGSNIAHGDPKQESLFGEEYTPSLENDIAAAENKIKDGGMASLFDNDKYSRTNPHSAEALKEDGNTDTELDRAEKIPVTRMTTAERSIAKFGAAIGVNVHFVNVADRGNRGVFTHNGEIYINRNASVPVKSVFIHEFTHWLKASPENAGAYDVLRGCLENINGMASQERLQKYRDSIYDGENMTDEEIIEEIICDALTHTETAEKLMRAINNVNPSLSTRIAGYLKAMWDKFCNMLGYNQKKPSSEQSLPNMLNTKEFARAEAAFNKILQSLKDEHGKPVFEIKGHELVFKSNGIKPSDTHVVRPITTEYSMSSSDRRNDSAREIDRQYRDLVERYINGDLFEDSESILNKIRDMVQRAAEKAGYDNAIPEQVRAYKARTGAAPKNTLKVYKVFTVDENGRPSALFVSSKDTLPQNVWLDAQDTYHFPVKNNKNGKVSYYVPSTKNPNSQGGATGTSVVIQDQKTLDELKKMGYISANAKVGSTITALAYRPGWHAGTLPFFPQGGMKVKNPDYKGKEDYEHTQYADTPYPNIHRYNQVVFECELAYDRDYNAEAKATHDGDLEYMPTDGAYYYATNPLTRANPELGAWAISGSLKIGRALTQEECDKILAEHGMPAQQWEGGSLRKSTEAERQAAIDNYFEEQYADVDNDGKHKKPQFKDRKTYQEWYDKQFPKAMQKKQELAENGFWYRRDAKGNILINKNTGEPETSTGKVSVPRAINAMASGYGYVSGKLDLAKLGYTGEEFDAARKTLAPITYDDNGKVIPLSKRFDPNVDDVRYSRDSTSNAQSNKPKRSRAAVGTTPSANGPAITDNALKRLWQRACGIMPWHKAEMPENMSVQEREIKEGGMNPIYRYWGSPQRLKKLYPKLAPFADKAISAVRKQEKLRLDYYKGMTEIDETLGYKEHGINDPKFKERKEALNNVLLQGDIQGKVYTNQELASIGCDTETIKAYRQMRALLDKAWKDTNDTKTRTVYQSEIFSSTSVGNAEIAELKKKNPFINVLSRVNNADGTVTFNYSIPHSHHVARQTVMQQELDELKNDKNVHIGNIKDLGDGNFAVSYDVKERDLGKIKGYVPHIFHGWYVCEVDENGDVLRDVNGEPVLDSIQTTKNSIKEAIAECEKLARANSDKHYKVTPQMFDVQGSGERAAIMGDFDYGKVISKVAKSMTLSAADAKKLMGDTVTVQPRGRFLGNTMHREGFAGYEQNIYVATMQYFNQVARYCAMDSFKRDSISMYNRLFGTFDSNKVMDSSAQATWVNKFIHDMNGDITGAEKWLNDILHTLHVGREVAGGRPGLWLINKLMCYPMTIAKLGVLNPSSALMNLTQLFNLYGAMGEAVASPKAYERLLNSGFKNTIQAMRNKNSAVGKLLWQDLGLEANIGMDVSSGYSNAEVRGLGSLTGRLGKLAGQSMYFFRQSDVFTRGVTLLTAYQKAIDEGKSKKDAVEYAKMINDRVNFDYSVADEPQAFRAFGPISKVLLQFKKYPVKQIELLQDIFKDGRVQGLNKKQATLRLLKYMAPYIAMSGMMGVPFISLMGGIGATAAKLAGDDDWDWQTAMKRYMIRNFGEDSPLTLWWLYGAGAFVGVNLGSRIGVGDFLGSDSYNKSSNIMELAFNQTTMGSTINSVATQAGYRNWNEVVKAISPSVGNILQATSGEVRTTRGRMKYQYQNIAERALRFIGFTPLNETMAGDLASVEYAEQNEQSTAKERAVDAFMDNPNAENAAKLNELGVTPSTIKNEVARRTMNKHQLNQIKEEKKKEREKSSKNKSKVYSAEDYLKALD